MKSTRREFVKGAMALGVMVPLVGCGENDEEVAMTFAAGVASGDPLTDRVILWTRVTSHADEVTVTYEVSESMDFDDIVTSGDFVTDASRDYTVKVDAKGLSAGTTYYYRFLADGVTSMIGRTRTAPQGAVERLRFGVMSCSNYAFGYFHGYRDAAMRADLDAIIHLGDYIYEYGDGEYGDFRPLDPPHEILTLSDYRRRYAYYRRDPDLQALHQQVPFIAVWDDHELANDAYLTGAENHTEGAEGSFADRKAVAQQVYGEWMPIRGPEDNGRIFRNLQFGDLMQLTMLDTRMWARTAQTMDPAELGDPERMILGADQLEFLEQSLADSTATWNVVGQQMMVTQLLLFGNVANPDQWDGYPAARQRLYDAIEGSGADNVVVLTGDIHASGVAELVRDPASYDPMSADGVLGVELVAPGITSPFIAPSLDVVDIALSQNPPLRWADGANRGYFILDVTPQRVQADYYLYPDPTLDDASVDFQKAFKVESGTPKLVEVDEPRGDAEGTELVPAV